MNMKEFLKTWEGSQTENKWGRIFIAVLLSVIVLLVMLVFRKETVVTIQPWTLEEEAWVTKNNASQAYKEAWGLALSTLIGNVQPSTVGFVKNNLAPILSTGIYQEVMDILEVQALDIKKDRITMRFEPRAITYEDKSNKVFVEGISFVKSASLAKEKRTNRTYEFVIGIEQYMPKLKYLQTYVGSAQTEEFLSKQKSKNAKQ